MYIDQVPDGMNGVTLGWCWEWKSSYRLFFQNKIPFKFVKSRETARKPEFCRGQSPVNITARHIKPYFPRIFTTTLSPSLITFF